jgi:hypothetical protein
LGFEFMRGTVCVLAGCIMIDGGLAMTRDTRLGVDAWMIAVVLGYQATVYVMQALAQSALGPSVCSWVFRNRPHYLPVNAHLRGWCRGDWHWLGYVSTITTPDGVEFSGGSCWGFDDRGYMLEEATAEARAAVDELVTIAQESEIAACCP